MGHVFELSATDFWTPPGCEDWPHDSQPRFWFKIPSAPQAQQFQIAQARLREQHGLEADDVSGFWALEDALELYLTAAIEYVTKVDNVQFEGSPIVWGASDSVAVGLTKRDLLCLVGETGRSRFFNLFSLVGTIMTGIRSGTKKNSAATSPQSSDTTSTSAAALSAPPADTTETTS